MGAGAGDGRHTRGTGCPACLARRGWIQSDQPGPRRHEHAMNPTAFAMRHPIPTPMLVVALVVGGGAALRAMRVDIFPPLNSPRVYVVCNYGGLDPGQVEGMLTNQFEVMFQYVDGVKSVDSRSIQNLVSIQLTFFPGTDMSQASAQVVAMTNRSLHAMPTGTL